jgi:TonB-dependent heme/hemoglobin receptor
MSLILNLSISAQQKSVTGTIADIETGKVLPGVSVFVKGTVIGTISDINGMFTLNFIPANSEKITFSIVGYKTLEKAIGKPDESNYEIFLEPSTVSLNEVVISAAKNELTSFQQTTPTSVVSPERINEFSIQNIPDIITREPSVSLAGAGYHKVPSIRGLARKRVVMLVDGHRISSERNPGPPGTFVNPLDIKKIEILRGPYSTLYGSDAVGGVVNILTKNYKKPLSNKYVGGTINSNYQSIRNGYNLNLLLNTALSKNLFLHLTAGKRKADSYKDADGDEVMGTNFSEQSVNAKITWQIHKNHRLQLKGLLSLADSIGKPAFNDSINALHPEDNHYIAGINYQWSNIAPWLSKMNISGSFHHHDITARIYNYRTITYGRVMNQQKNLYNDDIVYQHDFTFILNPKIKVLAGVDYYNRSSIHIDEQKKAWAWVPDNPGFHIGELLYEGPQDTIIHDSYQNSLGFFAQATYFASDKLSLNGGIRWNKFHTEANLVYTTQMGPPYDYSLNTYETKTKDNDAISGNLGASFTLSNNVTLFANAGQAFRVPSTKELFVNTMTPGGMNFANPDLIPEKSFNLDLSAKFTDEKNNNLTIAFFRNRIIDMIILEWDSLHASGVFNNKDALIYGGELSFDFKMINKLNLNGNLSYIFGEEDHGEVLMDIPPIQVNLEGRYFIKPGKAFVALAGRYNGKQEEVATGDVPADAFFVLDFLGGWRINDMLKVNVSVTNIFNNLYREHYQFDWVRQPGRSFNAGLNFNF